MLAQAFTAPRMAVASESPLRHLQGFARLEAAPAVKGQSLSPAWKPATALGSSLVTGAFAAVASSLRRKKARASMVARRYRLEPGTAEEEALLSLIQNKGDEKDRIVKACQDFPSASKDAIKVVEGIWKLKWDSGSCGKHKKTILKFICDALPNLLVDFYATFTRITDKEYEWLQGFTVPGTDNCNAAMVLSGERKKAKGNTLSFALDKVRMATNDVNISGSREMLDEQGLGRFLDKVDSKDKETYDMEVLYATKKLTIQKDELGLYYVYERIPDYPGIPFKLDKDSKKK
eukprot:TRINITY_DN44873_c0_g1_i1.p1 TRINITY_DN44873_c0_g1~~TRINITY_DN44873_c0_g1_i1.p1  ORF type:complete len:290 (+),score=75.23 TRINITY_DN44873_c0_g1_i1:53-922(+)